MEDRRCSAWSAGLTVAFMGLALVYCVYVFGPTHRGGGWFVPADAPMLLTAGSNLLHGHLHQVYGSSRELYDLPLSFPLTGLTALLTGWLHLPFRNHTRWIFVAVPMFVAMGFPVLQQARRLAWDLGMRRRLWAVQVVAVFLVLVPEIEWGHVEDVLAMACVLAGLRRLIRRDVVAACVLAGLAIGFKQWAVMILPFFVLAAPAGRRLRALAGGVAVPAVLALTFLAVDPRHALPAFLSPVVVVLGSPGHPWIDGTWLGSYSSLANRTAATLLAAGLAWRRRTRLADPYAVTGTVALTLLIRPLTETVNFSYYWSPALLLLAVVALARRPRVEVMDWLGPVMAMAWTLPHSNDLTTLDWWAGEGLILALTVWRLAAPLGLARPKEPPRHVGDRPQFAEVAG